jgi:hypothetical protein
MILEVDNKGAAVDVANNWSFGGRTRHHVEVRQYFLLELKEEGVILTAWVPGDTMSSDLFTKNFERPLFERHIDTCCGVDQYMKEGNKGSQGESGGMRDGEP